jgi:3-deoxy-manno-octulosonate cytidylyltransferase (CMP-KDO synthetase)
MQNIVPKFRIIIPARFASTRLPGKALLDIAGKPMLQHVYERASLSGATETVIATDDEKILAAANKFGAPVCMTASSHKTGTDRVSEAVNILGYDDDDIVVNVQGDEPLISVLNIQQVAENLFHHPDAVMATLCARITTAEDLFNPNVGKVVFDHANYALYFSRAPIPWDRERFAALPQDKELLKTIDFSKDHYYRHIGIYAYRGSFLRKYVQLAQSPIELIESAEQLRILWYGYRVHVDVAREAGGIAVDTAEDLAKVRKEFEVNKFNKVGNGQKKL